MVRLRFKLITAIGVPYTMSTHEETMILSLAHDLQNPRNKEGDSPENWLFFPRSLYTRSEMSGEESHVCQKHMENVFLPLGEGSWSSNESVWVGFKETTESLDTEGEANTYQVINVEMCSENMENIRKYMSECLKVWNMFTMKKVSDITNNCVKRVKAREDYLKGLQGKNSQMYM